MAKWTRKKINPDNINQGDEYTKNDNVSLENLNAITNAGFYSQDFAEKLVENIDVSEVGNVGTPSVSLVEGDGATADKPYKKFKFANLKGEQGIQGPKGEKGDSGTDIVQETGESPTSVMSQKATTNVLNNKVDNGDLCGFVLAFAGRTAPYGWLLCDGSAVSRTRYSDLFSVIGTTYGAGDDSTTFNLPNLLDKFIQGSNTAGTAKSAGLPNITGYGKEVIMCKDNYGFSGVFSSTSLIGDYWDTNAGGGYQGSRFRLDFNAANSNSIYGASNTVQPPSLTMKYYIHY